MPLIGDYKLPKLTGKYSVIKTDIRDIIANSLSKGKKLLNKIDLYFTLDIRGLSRVKLFIRHITIYRLTFNVSD